MRVCIYGAGAVGGHLAARLATGGADVSLVARGAHLAAIQANGLSVETTDGVVHAHPSASEDPRTLGVQDVVIVTVKAPSLPEVASAISPLLTADTPVVFVMNGIPWWYFHAHGGPLEGTRLSRIDPGGAVWEAVGPHRAVGAVAYTAGAVSSPGVIRAVNERNRVILGRPDARPDKRIDALAAVLRAGGLEVEVTGRIRDAVWGKVLTNLIGGSLGVLTASATKNALADPALKAAASTMADEGAAIARAFGCDPGDPAAVPARLQSSIHKQSIVQDLELHRTMEIDALFRMPLELARLMNVPTPMLDVFVALAAQRARAAGLYPG